MQPNSCILQELATTFDTLRKGPEGFFGGIMASYKLTYFDFSGSRGEEVRLALAIAGVGFEDNRISRDEFEAMKSELPFATLPVFEIEGVGIFGQSNAILRLIGRRHGLHPEDVFEAARHDALMEAAEDLRHQILPTMRIKDDAERLARRAVLAEDYIPQWARCIERQISSGPYAGGTEPCVADIKLFMLHRWISSGNIDGIPANVFLPFSRLENLAAALRMHPAVVEWYASRG